MREPKKLRLLEGQEATHRDNRLERAQSDKHGRRRRSGSGDQGKTKSLPWLPLLIFTLTASFQLALLPRQTLWIDEIFTLAMATGHSLEHPAATADKTKGDFIEPSSPISAADWQQYLRHESPPASPGRVVRAVLLSDSSPPFYYLLLYLWTLAWGTGDFALRSLSVLFSLGCFPFVVNVARRTGGEKSVVPACLFFSLAPLLFYYSTEGRMYSLVLLLLLVAASGALGLQEEGPSISRSILWIGSSAAGLLTHYFFMFPWAGIVIFLFLIPGKLRRREILCHLLGVGLLILPWYVAAFEYQTHLRGHGAWFDRNRPPTYDLLGASRDQLLQSFSGASYGLWRNNILWPRISLLIFSGVFLVSLVRGRDQLFRGPRLLLWLWFMGAALAPSAMDLLSGRYLSHHPRYALGAAPPAFLLMAYCLIFVGRLRTPLVVLILCCWSSSLLTIWRQGSRIGEPFRGLLRDLALTGTKGEAVIVDSIPSGVLGFSRYANKSTEIFSWIAPLNNRTTPESSSVFTHDYHRVVLVNTHGFHNSAAEEAWLRQHFEKTTKTMKAGFEVMDSRTKSRDF